MVFDWWVRNGDRKLTERGGNPNLLWRHEENGQLVVIDHNLAFDRHFPPRLSAMATATNFFEELDGKVFRATMAACREELERTAQMFKRMGTDRRYKGLDRDAANALWGELIKPKASNLQVSQPRVALVANPATQLKVFFEYYVERNFVTREYQDKALKRGVRGWLREADLQSQFSAERVGNDEYHAQFPFVAVEDELPVKAIKPLNLGYPDASRIIDHGGQWIVRINALKKRSLLPAQVLFAVEGAADSTAPGRAMREITDARKIPA